MELKIKSDIELRETLIKVLDYIDIQKETINLDSKNEEDSDQEQSTMEEDDYFDLFMVNFPHKKWRAFLWSIILMFLTIFLIAVMSDTYQAISPKLLNL